MVESNDSSALSLVQPFWALNFSVCDFSVCPGKKDERHILVNLPTDRARATLRENGHMIGGVEGLTQRVEVLSQGQSVTAFVAPSP